RVGRSRARDGHGRPRAARGGRGRLRDRDRRAGGRHSGQARRARLRARGGTGRRESRPHGAARRPGDDPRPGHRRRAPSRSPLVGESTHDHVSPAGTVEGDDTVRLFLALELPDDAVDELERWGERQLTSGRRVASFHVTLAFLGRTPRRDLESILVALREEAAATGPFELEPSRYRETRSVGMVVLADGSGGATGLAGRLHARLERLGLYTPERRPWLPHVTVLRFRERPKLDPPLPALGTFAPSGAAAFLSR